LPGQAIQLGRRDVLRGRQRHARQTPQPVLQLPPDLERDLRVQQRPLEFVGQDLSQLGPG